MDRKKIFFQERENELEIIVGWYSPIAVGLALLLIIWAASTFSAYVDLFTGRSSLLFAVLHTFQLVVSIAFGYFILCLFLNKTILRLNRTDLRVMHRPLPWFGNNKQLKVAEIQQLYVKEKVRQFRKGSNSYRYVLMAKMTSGTEKSIFWLDTLPAEQLQELEERLEQYLQIRNTDIPGEFKKNHQSPEANDW